MIFLRTAVTGPSRESGVSQRVSLSATQCEAECHGHLLEKDVPGRPSPASIVVPRIIGVIRCLQHLGSDET